VVVGLAGGCSDNSTQYLPAVPAAPTMAPPLPDFACPSGVTCEDHPAAYALRDAMSTSYGNYDLANRPLDGDEIRYIVIHTTDDSWDEAIKVFQDPANAAAANFLVRSSDGVVARFIDPRNVAWHAGNWYYNSHSIGVEHEAWAFEGYKWFTEAMYTASARLVRELARRYGVPLDRAHILGHDEVPGINQTHQKTMHWDPGPYWDWDHYMKLLHAPDNAPGTEGPEPDDEQVDTADIGSVIAIRPDYKQNIQPVTYCYSPDETMDCHAAPDNPVHFLYLRQAPDPMAPLIDNPYLTAWPGDRSFNWGTKVGTGTRWVLAARQNDWDAIYFSGQMAWFYNPGHKSSRLATGAVVTPRAGQPTAPVYGVGYPQTDTTKGTMPPPAMEKIYDIPAGQRYVVMDRVTGDYYWSKNFDPKATRAVVRDGTEYFQIDFNHREGFVKVADVDLVDGP
jgi:N-acetyl-anhydromuramyl-L-alanine amidase AmpD